MAHISSNDFQNKAGRSSGEFVAGMRPVTVHDFMEQAPARASSLAYRRACLANDPNETTPQSQVDRLISDLMDIIVRAAAIEGEVPAPEANESVAETVALSMMQALLQKQVCSSY